MTEARAHLGNVPSRSDERRGVTVAKVVERRRREHHRAALVAHDTEASALHCTGQDSATDVALVVRTAGAADEHEGVACEVPARRACLAQLGDEGGRDLETAAGPLRLQRLPDALAVQLVRERHCLPA